MVESEVNIVVTWNEVSNAQEYEINLYDAENNLVGGMTETLSSSNTRSHTFANLSPASTYTVGIVAKAESYRDSDEGRSAEITIDRVTLADITEGQNIMTRSRTTDSITLSWSESSAPDNATHYVLEISGGNLSSSVPVVVAISSRNYDFTGLDLDITHTTTVIARGDEAKYNDSSAFSIEATTVQRPSLRLRLKVFLEGPLQ